MADMVFGCGRYRLAVADIVVADVDCGRYGCTPVVILRTLESSTQCSGIPALFELVRSNTIVDSRVKLSLSHNSHCHGD